MIVPDRPRETRLPTRASRYSRTTRTKHIFVRPLRGLFATLGAVYFVSGRHARGLKFPENNRKDEKVAPFEGNQRYELCPAHCITPMNAVHGPTASRY